MPEPYQKFGSVLHTLRRKFHVSRADLCQALEISAEFLDKLEQGKEKPSEELVEQVINHFELEEGLANNLWLLAGYPLDKNDDGMTTAILPLAELKAVYTDVVHVSVNNYGVVLNFMQNIGPNNQPIVVSRLGMSKDHAYSIIDVLTRTLGASENQKGANGGPKSLPRGD